jgi:hypothetical protein
MHHLTRQPWDRLCKTLGHDGIRRHASTSVPYAYITGYVDLCLLANPFHLTHIWIASKTGTDLIAVSTDDAVASVIEVVRAKVCFAYI